MKKSILYVFCIVMVLSLSGCAAKDYKEAKAFILEEDYSRAKTVLEGLGDYKDSRKLIQKCDYENAAYYMKRGKYEKAAKLFEELEDYKDSEELLEECYAEMSREAAASTEERSTEAVSEPETTEPETAEPETTEPETAEPETTEPETTEPETAESESPSGTEPSPTTAESAEKVIPPYFPGNARCRQFILVQGQGKSCRLDLYLMEGDGWIRQYSCGGFVGKNGITAHKREGDGCTPGGEFEICFCLGASRPQTGLPYYPVTKDLVWVDETSSRYYNTMQSETAGYNDWGHEQKTLYEQFYATDMVNYQLFFTYNGDGIHPETATPGCGSEIFMNGVYDMSEVTSSGNVIIAAADMERLLIFLDKAHNPEIILQAVSELPEEDPAETVPAAEAPVDKKLKLVDTGKAVTQEVLSETLKKLAETYPEIIRLDSIGSSVCGRDIPLLMLGIGPRKVLTTAGMHAREHLSVLYQLKVAEDYAAAWASESGMLDGYDIHELLSLYTIYIVPCVNPDGNAIVLDGAAPRYVSSVERTLMKANANGVDLNCNFPLIWDEMNTGTNQPAERFYKGPSAASEPETQALINLCQNHDFECMLAFHTQRRVIYWRDETNGTVPGDEALARALEAVCGFELPAASSDKSSYGGGFENWFRKFGKPGFCVDLIDLSIDIYSNCTSKTVRDFEEITEYTRTRAITAAALAHLQ